MAVESGQLGGEVVRGLDCNVFSVIVIVFPPHSHPSLASPSHFKLNVASLTQKLTWEFDQSGNMEHLSSSLTFLLNGFCWLYLPLHLPLWLSSLSRPPLPSVCLSLGFPQRRAEPRAWVRAADLGK